MDSKQRFWKLYGFLVENRIVETLLVWKEILDLEVDHLAHYSIYSCCSKIGGELLSFQDFTEFL